MVQFEISQKGKTERPGASSFRNATDDVPVMRERKERNMERLTNSQIIKCADGSTHKQLYCFGHLWGPAFFKKGTEDYEEYIAIVERLAEYEDLEEQGKLLRLPVAVGDRVYRVRCETFIERCSILGFAESCTVCYMVYIDPDEEDVIELSDFGKTVFLTKEEAEAALKELERGKRNETD